MIPLQKAIEDIIQKHIQQMTGQKQQRKALHLSSTFLDALASMYDADEDPVAFINHFGHIEYRNRAYDRLLMLDHEERPFNNMSNLDSLPVTFELEGGTVTATYPRGKVKRLRFKYHLVTFQKTCLLKLSFKDRTAIHASVDALEDYRSTVSHYLKHSTSPMFQMNDEGFIQHAPVGAAPYLGVNLERTAGESVYDVLPYDYAKELMDRVQNITEKVSGHFMYQTKNDRMVKMYDTTVIKLNDKLFLSQLVDVSDLNTMSSTIEYLNSYDSLTGFHNTNYYENILSTYKDLGHLPLGIYALNLQGLKQANNRLGHHKTDNLIIDISLYIKSLVSQHEVTCRVSGDTFIIFFPNSSKGTMVKFSKKMSEHIKTCKAKYSDFYITYTAKQAYITTNSTPVHDLVKGLIT